MGSASGTARRQDDAAPSGGGAASQRKKLSPVPELTSDALTPVNPPVPSTWSRRRPASARHRRRQHAEPPPPVSDSAAVLVKAEPHSVRPRRRSGQRRASYESALKEASLSSESHSASVSERVREGKRGTSGQRPSRQRRSRTTHDEAAIKPQPPHYGTGNTTLTTDNRDGHGGDAAAPRLSQLKSRGADRSHPQPSPSSQLNERETTCATLQPLQPPHDALPSSSTLAAEGGRCRIVTPPQAEQATVNVAAGASTPFTAAPTSPAGLLAESEGLAGRSTEAPPPQPSPPFAPPQFGGHAEAAPSGTANPTITSASNSFSLLMSDYSHSGGPKSEPPLSSATGGGKGDGAEVQYEDGYGLFCIDTASDPQGGGGEELPLTEAGNAATPLHAESLSATEPLERIKSPSAESNTTALLSRRNRRASFVSFAGEIRM